MKRLRGLHATAQAVRESRSGFHVSGLLYDLDPSRRSGGWRTPSPFGPDDFHLRIEAGYAWEDLLGRAYFTRTEAESVESPGTLEQDGLLGTPDGWEPGAAVYEYKATWKSMQRDQGLAHVRSRWAWQHQMKAYCHMLAESAAVLKVFYVNGDYKPPAPAIAFYLFEWEKAELERTWEMLVAHKDRLVAEGRTRI